MNSQTLIPTHCSFCGIQCGMNLVVEGGSVIGVEPRQFVHNQGTLCPKGMMAYEQINHADRLTQPLMRRAGRNSPLEPVSWDEALDAVATRFAGIQAAKGRDAVAVYSGSALTNEKCYVTGKFARVGLRTRHIDYAGRLCMSSAASAYNQALGLDRSPLAITELPKADCIVVVGSNISDCFPILMSWILESKSWGGRLIVLDPRQTGIARMADLWLPLRPGTDAFVLNAMLRQIIQDGRIDEAYIADRTVGWEDVKASVEPHTMEEAARISGVPVDRIMTAARVYGMARTSVIVHARGIEQQVNGVNNCLACINLALARGQFGKPGSGTMMLTGSGNGQGARELGQRADELPGYRSIENAEDREYIAGVWGVPADDLPGAGVPVSSMMRMMTEGEIAGCLVLSTNPALSMPDTPFVRKALDSLEFLVVLDPFMSETAEMADVVLPSAIWVEDEGTVTNLEGRMLKINPAAEPPGEARPDWWILREIARRLGRGEFFQYDSPQEIFEELRVATKGGRADYSGLTWEKIESRNGEVFEPCVSDEDSGEPQLYKERFAHPDGKARFIPAPHRPPAEEPNDEFPFYLTNGRFLFQYLTGNQTRRIESLNGQSPYAFVEINQREAERLRITNGTVVRVRTPRGSVEVKASIVNTIRPDTLFLPMHYPGVAGVNQVTNPVVEPSVSIPEFKVAAATIEPVSAPVEPRGQATEHYSPETDPAMYPYITGDTNTGVKG